MAGDRQSRTVGETGIELSLLATGRMPAMLFVTTTACARWSSPGAIPALDDSGTHHVRELDHGVPRDPGDRGGFERGRD